MRDCEAGSIGEMASETIQVFTSARPDNETEFLLSVAPIGAFRDTQKVLSNVPQDIKCPAPRQRKIHDNSMYCFACRCTNEIIHANSMYFFEIVSNTMHTRVGGGEAAANSSIRIDFDAIWKKYMLLACIILFVRRHAK